MRICLRRLGLRHTGPAGEEEVQVEGSTRLKELVLQIVEHKRVQIVVEELQLKCVMLCTVLFGWTGLCFFFPFRCSMRVRRCTMLLRRDFLCYSSLTFFVCFVPCALCLEWRLTLRNRGPWFFVFFSRHGVQVLASLGVPRVVRH